MKLADGVLWPLATGGDRARWAAQAPALRLHLVRLILTRAAVWPAVKQPLGIEATTSTSGPRSAAS